MSKVLDIGLPDKIEVLRHSGNLHIVRKWFGIKTVFFTVSAIFWNSCVIIYYTDITKLAALYQLDESAPFTVTYIPLLHVAVGIWIAYCAIAGWFNKTNIIVNLKAIEVKHDPVPWVGNKRLEARKIKQLYGREKVHKTGRGGVKTYEVRAITNNGKNVKLLSGLDTSEQALFIEQEIEKYLGIEDTKIHGELG